MAEQLAVYEMDDFSGADGAAAFYINTFADHFRQNPFITTPHRHDFYIVVHFTAGSGTHIIDFVDYTVVPGSVFFLTPGQVHNWSLSPDTEGSILFFKKEFIEDYFNKKINTYRLFRNTYQMLRPVDMDVQKQVTNQMDAMASEYDSLNRDPDLIRSALDMLLIRLGKLLPAQEVSVSGAGTMLIQQLEELIEKEYAGHRPPVYYARQLHCSVKYLNELCKKHLGKTTSQLIHNRLILEAKRLLVHQDLSIKEISARLQFEDQAWFARLFKKTTGQTPIEFRMEGRGV